MMTPRSLRWSALGIALLVQTGMVVTVGTFTDWCFCAMTTASAPPVPPPFVMRFLDLTIPAGWMPKGMGLPGLFIVNLEAWFLGVLALLYGLVFAARIRLRPLRAGAHDGCRIRLADRESVRARQLVVMGLMLAAAGMTAGAQYRRWWLAEAERVFAVTMADASAGRPPGPGVQFAMYARDAEQPVPESTYETRVDPRRSGDHLLDTFVAPYTYGGKLRFASGAVYEFSVSREKDAWSVNLYELRSARR